MSATQNDGFPRNPNHPCGTCGKCGAEMAWNVPGLGPAGGFVHKATGSHECALPLSKESAPAKDDKVKTVVRDLLQMLDSMSPDDWQDAGQESALELPQITRAKAFLESAPATVEEKAFGIPDASSDNVKAVLQNTVSVQPLWCLALPVQQQSVLLLGARGPDGIAKAHPCKDVQRAYRGTVLVAAKYGRCLHWGERADTFMSLELMTKMQDWEWLIDRFFEHSDDLPHHFLMHLAHGAEIIGYKHPDERLRIRWKAFYFRCAKELHLTEESMEEMDARLSDWERKHWEIPSVQGGNANHLADQVSPTHVAPPVSETQPVQQREWTAAMVAEWASEDFSWAKIAERHNASLKDNKGCAWTKRDNGYGSEIHLFDGEKFIGNALTEQDADWIIAAAMGLKDDKTNALGETEL